MATDTTTFDLDGLSRAIESRDADAQATFYAEDAEYTLVDKDNPPSRPLVLHGRQAIAEALADVANRDMTHRVSELVQNGSKVACRIDCTYPDGSKVLCFGISEVSDGKIVRQSGVQAWDD